ncbi:LuxR C-terminal-related transcriptional regulator [Streptomyces acidicola]|uniref:LuxR C-terminal-related transcriptional regulator n=1 Tax=Streptomyces acidicola TaxID=2596892 RepID=UPI003822387D
MLEALVEADIDRREFLIVANNVWYQTRYRRTSSAAGRPPAGEMVLDRVEPPYGLTLSELNVLTLVADGLNNGEISARLHISRSTVSTHIEHILAKLGAKNRTLAAVMAVTYGVRRMPAPGTDRTVATGASRMAGDDPLIQPYNRPRSAPRREILLGSAYSHSDLDGTDMLRGAEVAVDVINREGGVGGRYVEHVPIDVDPNSHESVVGGVRRLAEMGVDAIAFGYTYQRERIPDLIEAVAETGIPFVHAMTSQVAEDMVASSPPRYGNVFQVSPGDGFYGTEFIDFVCRRIRGPLGQGRDAVLVTDDVGIVGHFEGWRRHAGLRDMSLELVVVDASQDWAQAADLISGCAPSAAVIACFDPQRAISFLERFLEKPVPTLLYGVWAPGVTAFSNRLSTFEGLFWASTTGMYHDVVGAGFQRRFRDLHRRPALGQGASVQYDTIQLLRGAWASTSSPSHPSKVLAALRHGVHRGVNGSYYLGLPGQRPLSYPAESTDGSLAMAHLIYQVQNGQNVLVAPSPYARTRPVMPPWFRRR